MLEETIPLLHSFSDKWKNVLLPQILHYLDRRTKPTDVTEILEKSSCHLIRNAVKDGKRVYAILFRECKGLVSKWKLKDGKRVRDEVGRPVLDRNPSTMVMSVVDVISPFINSDEVLSITTNRERAYNLKRGDVEAAVMKCGGDPEKDTVFFLIHSPEDIEKESTIFLESLLYFLKEEPWKRKERSVVEVEFHCKKRYPSPLFEAHTTNFLGDVLHHRLSKRSCRKLLRRSILLDDFGADARRGL